MTRHDKRCRIITVVPDDPWCDTHNRDPNVCVVAMKEAWNAALRDLDQATTRLERAEALLHEWLEAPWFSTESAWKAWRDAFAFKVYNALGRSF